MNKEAMIGLGLIATGLMGIGFIIGAVVMDKNNDKHKNEGLNIWKSTAEFFKDQLLKEYDKNEDLRKQLDSKKEA